MARMRTVKPEFFRSATIGKLDRDTRLLFIGMWTEADDHGRGLAEPRHLAGTLFPFDRDVTERKVTKWLHELEDVVCTDGSRGLVVRYEANGTTYYAIRNWWHQKVNRPGDPRYPAPPSETLFDSTSHSVNRRPKSSESHSLNETRQGSGVRGQGSGTSDQEISREEIDLPATGPGALSNVSPPSKPIDSDDRHSLHEHLGVFIDGCPACQAAEAKT